MAEETDDGGIGPEVAVHMVDGIPPEPAEHDTGFGQEDEMSDDPWPAVPPRAPNQIASPSALAKRRGCVNAVPSIALSIPEAPESRMPGLSLSAWSRGSTGVSSQRRSVCRRTVTPSLHLRELPPDEALAVHRIDGEQISHFEPRRMFPSVGQMAHVARTLPRGSTWIGNAALVTFIHTSEE